AGPDAATGPAGGSAGRTMIAMGIAPATTTAAPIAAHRRLLDPARWPTLRRELVPVTAPADPLSVVGAAATIGLPVGAGGMAGGIIIGVGKLRMALPASTAPVVRQPSRVALTSAAQAGRMAGSFARSAMISC